MSLRIVEAKDPGRLVRSDRATSVVKTGGWRYFRPIHSERLSPCRARCPVGNHIAKFVLQAAQGDFKSARQTLLEENPLPAVCGRVCYRPCEVDCNRGQFDEKIAIRAIEREAAERGGGANVRVGSRAKQGKKVAVVGSGPAGLSCSYFLARLGYDVSIYEQFHELGGLLRYGIPAYRLPKHVLNKEIEHILSWRISAYTDTRIGKDLNLPELREEHDAVFLSIGAWKSVAMKIEGEDFADASGLSLLQRINNGEKVDMGRVCIVGGGNTAVDVARTILRLGGTPFVLYRRSYEDMPAFKEEVLAAQKEGVQFEFQTLPIRIERKNGGVRVECVKTGLSGTDTKGRRLFTPMEGTGFSMSVDTVVPSVGEVAEWSGLAQFAPGENGFEDVGVFQGSDVPGVFCGGDMVPGVRSVADAIGAGKRAAVGIDLHLREREDWPTEMVFGTSRALSFSQYLTGTCYSDREPVPFEAINLEYFQEEERVKVPLKETFETPEALGFEETVAALDPQGAIREANRCFGCGFCNGCGNCYVYCPDMATFFSKLKGLQIDYDYCKGCGICVRECPRGVITQVEETE